MKKMILLSASILLALHAINAQVGNSNPKQQFLLIFRFKANFVPPSQQAVQNNIQHWQQYMGGLGQSGALLGGYRPAGSGRTISGADKTEKDSVYVANNEMVSSFIIIKAASLDDAGVIAKKCPIFEFGGSVEIRPLTETAK